MAKGKEVLLADEVVMNKIYLIRGQKVMLDKDLSELYGVETRRLNEQVRRNILRFPEDFMFQLSEQEFKNLKSQFATSSWGGTRKTPLAFTEQGVAMLSGVLNSTRAIKVNIQIMRIYTKMREMLLTNKDILLKIEQLEKKVLKQDDHQKKQGEEIQLIFQYLKELLNPPQEPTREVGFKQSKRK
jgi:hypothetical protein